MADRSNRENRVSSSVPLLRDAVVCGVAFLVAGSVTLGHDLLVMMLPMIPAVIFLVACLAICGVYRHEFALFSLSWMLRSALAFALFALLLTLCVNHLMPDYAHPRFLFFFPFFTFFVINTLRPLMHNRRDTDRRRLYPTAQQPTLSSTPSASVAGKDADHPVSC